MVNTNGTATTKPPIRTTSCKALTQAELSNAAGGEVHRHRDAADGNTLPSRQSGHHFEHRGSRDQLPGQHRQRADRNQDRDQAAYISAVSFLEKIADGEVTARRRQRPEFGPTQRASTKVPRPTAPFHHSALMPSWYARPVAPTVAPAPMLAASTVDAMSGHVSLRPATKKSAGTLTQPADPQAERGERDGVADQEDRRDVHGRRRSRTAG